jgi:hypothetical protein
MKKNHLYMIGGGLLIAGGSYYVYKKYFSRGMSKKGMEFLNFLETGGKIYPKMILDTKNLPTIGIGHLIKPTEKYLLTATLTKKQIYDLFNKDLDWAEKAVSDTIKVPLKNFQYRRCRLPEVFTCKSNKQESSCPGNNKRVCKVEISFRAKVQAGKGDPIIFNRELFSNDSKIRSRQIFFNLK